MPPSCGPWETEALEWGLDNVSAAEAAVRWGCSPKAASARMMRAVRRAQAAPTTLGPRMPRINDRSATTLRRQLANCCRDLGESFVAELGADDLESVELQQLHAALRVVLLEAEGLIPLVRERLRLHGRAALDVAATSVRRAA